MDDMDWWMDFKAWAIGAAFWLLFVSFANFGPSVGLFWSVVTYILTLPVCYACAKFQLDR